MSQSQPPSLRGLSAGGQRAARGLLLVLGLALSSSCRCGGEEEGRAGTTNEESLAACRAACAAYAGAKCPAPGVERADECTASCLSRGELSNLAGCRAERLAYLDCLGRSAVDCGAVISAPGVALEQGEGAAACAEARRALDRCDAPCRHTGSVHLGEAELAGTRAQAELVRDGCAECRKPEGGAPSGSPCESAKVCQQYCCACDTGPARYRARACVNARCADREAACSLAPKATAHDACSR